jgi:hypothetical protein
VWLTSGVWNGQRILDFAPVSGISSFLRPADQSHGKPHKLAANKDRSFNGTKVYGQGFVMTPSEANDLIQKDPRNRDVLFPYLIGDDVNNRPDHSPSRWAINFYDWPLNRKTSAESYVGPVAADYPDCLSIIETRVKPERTRRNENGEFVLRHPAPITWWIHGEKRPKLYSTIKKLSRVIVKALGPFQE